MEYKGILPLNLQFFADGGEEPGVQQPVNTPTTSASTPTPDLETLAQTLVEAVQKRTARAENSVIKSIADQYSMSESEVAAILSKARDEKAKAIPDDVQQRINQANEQANKRLLRAEVKVLGEAMGLADVDAALMMMDVTKATIKDNGDVEGVQALLDALKTEKPYLFPQKEQPAAWAQKQGGNAPEKVSRAAQLSRQYHEMKYGKVKE